MNCDVLLIVSRGKLELGAAVITDKENMPCAT